MDSAELRCSVRKQGYAHPVSALILVLFFVSSATVQGQFNYVTNNGTITITAFTGGVGQITIPGNISGMPVTRIGDGAFLGQSLIGVTIPNSILSIGDEAFAACRRLTSVNIPRSVISIGDRVFRSCDSLVEITVDGENQNYVGVDGVLFDKGQTRLIQCPNAKVGDYTIPGSVTRIEDWALDSCKGLTSITIPTSVVSIGGRAFSSCTSLQTITVDAGNQYYVSVDGVLFDKSQTTLIQCPGARVGNYAIPGGVSSIGDGGFSDCANLTFIAIPHGATRIGDWAFSGCASLSDITIPNTVTNIGESSFQNCGSVTSVAIPNGITSVEAGAFSGCSNLANVVIPDSVTRIGQSAFAGTALISFTIPGTVTNVGAYAFLSCDKLISITIPNGITSIESWQFAGCSRLTNVEIPNSVTIIGDSAFRWCVSLTSITIPDSVTNISGGVFSGCTSLASIRIPSGVTTINFQAFLSCPGLTNITIPSSVSEIGQDAFTDCTGLTSITIPASVKYIGSWAFSRCTNLVAVYFEGDAPASNPGVFLGTDSVTVYYLPGTTGWSSTFGGRPTAPRLPQIQPSDDSFGVRTNRFGFNVHWANGSVVVVEASTNLASPVWTPVSTNTLADGSSYFSDAELTNHPARFYRVRWW